MADLAGERRLGLTGSACLLALLAAAPQASAQDAPQPVAAPADASIGQAEALQDIVVTARKREERLLDVPVSITAFSAENIREEGITTLSDIATHTAGVTDDTLGGGSGRNDRSFQSFVTRGMPPSLPSNPTTSVFIDGATVSSSIVEGIDDLERVEVLKGPQSAYFGRDTFAGAINLITRDPSDTYKATISGLVGSEQYTDFRGTVEGPIIPGVIDARVSVRNYAIDGSYSNKAAAASKGSPDETLGDQGSKSINFEVVARPVDNLKIKLVGLFWNDNDGPSAQVQTAPSQANCFVTYYCGTAPKYLPTYPAANTVVDQFVKGYITNQFGKINSNLYNFNNALDHYGLNRDAFHASANVDYYVEKYGFTISSITAINQQAFTTLQDLDNTDTSGIRNALAFLPGNQPFFNWPFGIEQRRRDLTQEVRLASDEDQRFRWLVGASYVWTRTDQNFSESGPFGVQNFPSGATSERTVGGFFGLSYNIFDDLILGFDGRYQVANPVGYNIDDTINAKATFHDFLPRTNLQWKITPDLMTYVTYSEGVNPGTFNTGLERLSPANQLDAATRYGAKIVVTPEHLKNYELGVKGRFLDGRATLAADVYYDIWEDQITANNLVYVTNGVPDLQSPYINNGKTTLRGLEVDGTLAPIRHLVLNFSGAINDSRIDTFKCLSCIQISGVSDTNGRQLPNTSRYQLALGAQYTRELPFAEGWNGFARVDYIYKSGQYDLQANFVQTDPINLVNLRAGIESNSTRIEGFVTNLTNDRAYTNITTSYNLASPKETFAKPDSLVLGLPQLRIFGIRVTHTFGT